MLHAQIMHMFCVFVPQMLKCGNSDANTNYFGSTSPRYYPIMYQTKISIFLCFGPQVPIYGNLAPDPSILGILNFFLKYQRF